MNTHSAVGSGGHASQRTLAVTFPDGSCKQVALNTTVGELVDERAGANGLFHLGAMVNNDVVSLTYPLETDSEIAMLTLADSHGERIYRRSLSLLMAKVIKDLFPEARFTVEHSLGSGLYCTFEAAGAQGITEEQLSQIEARAREIVARSVPIERHKVTFQQAVERFETEGQHDKVNLLRFRNPPKIVLYSIEGFSDLGHGVVAPSTAALHLFELVHYKEGFMVQFPDTQNPDQVRPFTPFPYLYQIFKEHKGWGRILGLTTVGQLNEIIARREIDGFIKIAEALHEKKIARIADEIYKHHDRIRTLLIAGPSCAGKTTLTKRLAIQLRVNGLRPRSVSVDDYFVNRDDTPRDANGNYDFEHIDAIDLELFNDNLMRLIAGEEVDLPRFNFEKGEREYRGDRLRLAPDEILILEGIHCLNPRLSATVDEDHKFRIYVSALTQLNLDHNSRISTTDNRLLRRLVRDYQFRGHSALTTLRMWPSVREGEKRWIFPTQHEADIAFNSALDYELAVLKPMAEPLLAEVKPDVPEYATARRMQEFLSYFVAAPEDLVPKASILREYIGGSSFKY